jgi:hypothetical protein
MLIRKLTAKAPRTPRKRQAEQFSCGYAAPCEFVESVAEKNSHEITRNRLTAFAGGLM